MGRPIHYCAECERVIVERSEPFFRVEAIENEYGERIYGIAGIYCSVACLRRTVTKWVTGRL